MHMTSNVVTAHSQKILNQVRKVIVGKDQSLLWVLAVILARGHILLEDIPGVGKTTMAVAFSKTLNMTYNRVQFTPDVLPSDVTGYSVPDPATGKMKYQPGAVLCNLFLADELNRATSRTQSALLEAMAEGQVTIGEETYKLPAPFFVLATQNPIEQEGTYNLPEAELDRFLMKLLVSYPSVQEEVRIIQGGGKQVNTPVSELLTAERLTYCRQLLEQVACDEKIVEYIVSIVAATRPAGNHAGNPAGSATGAVSGKSGVGRAGVRGGKEEALHRYISFGASPRAGIALFHCAKAQALLSGRDFVLPEDVKAMAIPVLRHRLVLSYEAAAEGVTTDDLIARILSLLPLP